MRSVAQLLALMVCVTGLATCVRAPISEERAKQLAQESFESTCVGFHYDPASFSGPTSTRVGGAAFAYEWKHTAPRSDFGIVVTIDRGGGTNVSFSRHIPGVKYPGEQ